MGKTLGIKDIRKLLSYHLDRRSFFSVEYVGGVYTITAKSNFKQIHHKIFRTQIRKLSLDMLRVIIKEHIIIRLHEGS